VIVAGAVAPSENWTSTLPPLAAGDHVIVGQDVAGRPDHLAGAGATAGAALCEIVTTDGMTWSATLLTGHAPAVLAVAEAGELVDAVAEPMTPPTTPPATSAAQAASPRSTSADGRLSSTGSSRLPGIPDIALISSHPGGAMYVRSGRLDRTRLPTAKLWQRPGRLDGRAWPRAAAASRPGNFTRSGKA
jgi:hypothetical protein